MEDVTKNTEPKIVRPIGNHRSELWHINNELKTSWEPIWDPPKNQVFWYHETIVTSPHAKKNKIDWLQKQIDELHQLQGKGFSDDVRNVQSSRMNILDEEEFH